MASSRRAQWRLLGWHIREVAFSFPRMVVHRRKRRVRPAVAFCASTAVNTSKAAGACERGPWGVGIFDLWLAGWTQQEIADEVGLTQGEVAKSIPKGELAELNKSQQSAATHSTDFDVPLRCYTEVEIAERLGMPQKTLNDGVLAEIKEFEIPLIPGMFSDDLPEDNAPEKAAPGRPGTTTTRARLMR